MSTTSTTNDNAHHEDEAVPMVRAFLDALARADADAALALLDENIVYTNVSLPTVRGRAAVARLFGPMLGRVGFRVHFHAAMSDDGVVLTERTDALLLGPIHWQFWVYGRFEVRRGKISLWRDSFDWLDLTIGLIRGLVGVVLPGARRRWPSA
jgi:limonene-1,2-epoxide hydrolase